MKSIRSMVPLAALVASAAACSGKLDGPPGTATHTLSSDSSALSSFDHHRGAIVPQLLKSSPTMEPTSPANGDVNPYGVAFVPRGFPRGGLLRPGDIIVSNFNNSSNQQGTGTTIVRTDRKNGPDLFFQDDATPGLSTALGVLERGFVIVGNVPSIGQMVGMCNDLQADVGQGQLTVLDRHGDIVATLDDRPFVEGPWDLTLDDHGDFARLYVSNVLTGAVTRIDLSVGRHTVTVDSETVIASGYGHRCDMAAFVLGPTGLAHDEKRDVLYVASTEDNVIFAVDDASDRHSDAGMGHPVVTDQHLRGPLGLVLAANGNFVSAQGDAINPDPDMKQVSEIVEFTKHGDFVAQISVDSAPGGAFGIALEQKPDDPDDFRFAAVDDNGVPPFLDVWDIH